MGSKQNPGFTMVELLVVIGIIAVMIAMLMPALARARQQADQVACMSNLRQLGTAYQLYADGYRDQVPLGYYNDQGWTGYFLVAEGEFFPIFGALYHDGLLAGPEAFFCPAQADQRWKYNSPNNPLPPQPPMHTRAGYMARPTTHWLHNNPLTPLPRLTRMKNKALASDLCGIPGARNAVTQHPRQINVLYGDRSVRPVPESAYEALQAQIVAMQPVRTGPQKPQLSLFIDENNPDANALWNIFDRN